MAIDPLGKYGKIDIGKYGQTFDNMFGAGAYDRGISSSRANGTRIGTLMRDRALWEEQQAELEAMRKELEALQEAEAEKQRNARQKAEDQGRGGHLPTRDNQLKQRKAIEDSDKKYGSISKGTLIPRADMTPYRRQLMGLDPSWDEKPKKKKEDKGFLGGIMDFIEKDTKKKAKNKVNQFKAVGDIFGEIGAAGKAAVQGFNPLDDVSMSEAFDNYANRDRSKAVEETQRGANNLTNSLSLGAMANLNQQVTGERPYYTSQREFGEGGGIDMLTRGAGYLLPGAAAAKTIRGLTGMTTAGRAALARPIASKAGLGIRALEGAAAGAGITAAEVGVRESLNPENFSAGQNLMDIGINAAAGAVLDPLADLGLSRLRRSMGNDGIGVIRPKQPPEPPEPLLGLPEPQLGLPEPPRRLPSPTMSSLDNPINPYTPPVAGMPRTIMQVGRNANSTNPIDDIVEGVDPTLASRFESPEAYRKAMDDYDTEFERLADRDLSDREFNIADRALRRKYNLDDTPNDPLNTGGNDRTSPQKLAKEFKKEGMMRIDAEKAYEAVVRNPDPVPMSENPIAASAQAKGKVIDHRNELKKAADKSRKLGEGRLSHTFSSFQKNWIDDQAYIRYAENELTGKSRIAPKGEAAQAFQLVNGSAGKAEYVLTRELSPVFSRLQKKGGDTEQALEYMTALHMQELNKSFKAQGKEYVFPGGYDIDHFNNIVDINKGRPEYEEFTESISKYTNHLLDELQSAGVLSSDAVKEMKGQYKYYVPKYRQQDLEPDAFEAAFYNNFSSISSKNPVKSLKEGSDEPIQDIVSSLEAMTFKTMQSAASNNAKKKLADLASLDTKGTWISKTKSGNKIEYFDKGQKKEIFVNKELAEAIKGADPVEINDIQKVARSLSKFQRLSITGSPAFVARNAIRDAQQSWMNSKSGFTAYDYAVSALDVISDGKLLGKKSNLDKFYESGAASSNIWSQDKTQFRTFQNQAFKQKKGFKDSIDPRKYMDWYRENILEKSDYFPKVAEFRAAKRKGYSDDEAAYMARDLMDFFRAGKNVRGLNPYVGFLNTTIQGRSRFMRSFSESVAEKDVKRGLRLVTRNAMGAIVPSVMAFTTYQTLADDDIRKKTIDEAPAYLRDTFWLLPDPFSDNVIRLPKPFEAAAYFSNPVEYTLRADAGIANDINETASKWLLDNVFFNPSLNVLNPIYESVFNKDTFTDAPIIPQREANMPSSEQYDVNTSTFARGLGGLMDKLPLIGDTQATSPRIIDNFVEGMFPVGGEQVLNATDSALESAGAIPNRNLPASNQNPLLAPITDVLGQFRVPTDGRTSPLVSEVYETNDRMKGLKQMDKNGNPDLTTPRVDVGSQVSALNELSKIIRETLNDPNMNPEAKRDTINNLTNQRNEIARMLQEQGLLE